MRTISVLGSLFSAILVISIIFASIYSGNADLPLQNIGVVDEVTLTVLVDNYKNGTLPTNWGISILVETSDTSILFDAAENPGVLQNNSEILGKDLKDIDFVVLSHGHFDHYGGLEYIGNIKPNASVYIPSNMAGAVKDALIDMELELVEINETTIVSAGIVILKALPSAPEELSIVINIEGVGAAILIGCSHPGSPNIVNTTIQELGINPYLAIGGFFLFMDTEPFIESVVADLIDLDVKKICPIHCSGDLMREYVKENHPDRYIEGCVGTTLVLNAATIDTQRNSLIIIPIIVAFILLPLINQYKNKRKTIRMI